MFFSHRWGLGIGHVTCGAGRRVVSVASAIAEDFKFLYNTSIMYKP